ncbi:MAG: hypothetical protein GY838_10730 [bacterium]|nr:hypothetical protein [bacterium]
MRRILFALMGFLLLPAFASATEFGESSVQGSCLGYAAAFDVEFHPAVYEINYGIVVTIIDETQAELFRYEDEGVLERLDANVLQSYNLAANWNDVTDETIPLFGMMDIRVELRLFYSQDSPFWSTNTAGKLLVMDDRLECAVVGADDLSWSAIKADFR